MKEKTVFFNKIYQKLQVRNQSTCRKSCAYNNNVINKEQIEKIAHKNINNKDKIVLLT